MTDNKKFCEVLGSRIAYVDRGEGPPVLFLHGNPTSSHLWRDVIPHVEGQARCLAPDLLGMGDSDKLADPGPQSYRFAQHAEYLDAWIEAVLPGQALVLVVHDWGSALGFDWARQHPDRARGICYMEAIVRPVPDWDAWPDNARNIFQAMRSPAGEELVLEKNIFVERILPGATLGGIAEEDMAVYRRPFANPGEDRRPTLTWPREIPVAGEPADVVERVGAYARWLETAPVPKLLVNADPGSIMTGAALEYCRSWPHQEEITVPGSHFVQEDSADAIGRAVAGWLARLDS